VKVKLLTKVIVNCPAGTEINGGCQPPVWGKPLIAAHVALVGDAPQLYPHIGTVCPSGKVVLVGAAVRVTALCANAAPLAKRRAHAAKPAFNRAALFNLEFMIFPLTLV
jgi:hypothetical protein